MVERRTASRHKSFLRGRIFFNKGRSSADCLIRDVSEHGARLVFSGSVAIPDSADLYVPQKEQTLRVKVQWRHGDEVGVIFLAGMQASEPGTTAEIADLGERVQKLEAEIAVLRRTLKRLQAVVPAADLDVA